MYRNAVLVPFDDTATFPTKVECDVCEGAGGFDDRPRSGGDRMEPDDYYWNGCDYCDEQGYFFDPTVKVICRYTIKLSWRKHEKHPARTLDCPTGQIPDYRENVQTDRHPNPDLL